jgi:hypothetical protein
MRRLTEWVVDHPKRVVWGALLLTLAFAAWIPFLQFEVDFKRFLPRDDPAVQAMDRAEARYGSQEIILVLIEVPEILFDPDVLQRVRKLEERLEALPEVEEVQGLTTAQVITGTEREIRIREAAREIPQTAEEMAAYRERLLSSRRLRGVVVTEDGRAGAIVVRLKARAPRIGAASRILQIAAAYRGPERISVAGLPVIHATIIDHLWRDLIVLIPLVIGVVVLVLLLSFRDSRALPVMMPVVGMSLIWTLGTMVLLGQKFTPFAVPLPVMLVAIGIADGIHILNRYHEEAAQGRPKRGTILRTMEAMRAPVVMTSLTTAAGFLSLTSSFITAQRTFGAFIALGVLFAMVLSLTWIPAMLARFEPRQAARRARGELLGEVLARSAPGIARSRIPVLVLAGLIALACGLAVPRIRVETIPKQFLGENNPVVRAMDVADRRFGGSAQVAIEIDTGRRDELKDPQVLREMVELQERLEALEGVHHATLLADVVRELNQKFHADDPQYYRIPEDRKLIAQLLLLFTFQGGDLGQLALGDFSAGEVIARARFTSTAEVVALTRRVQDELKGFPGDFRVEEVDALRAFASLFAKMPVSQALSLALSAAAAALIVMLLMRSVLAGLICIVPLLLTVLINFGIMGYSGMPLDMATLTVASIAIGVGIDYAIHFVFRFRREAARWKDREEAFIVTMRTEGKAIAYNAIVVALGFAVLLGSSFRGLVNLGALVSLTMVISALSAFLVIPALLLGGRSRLPSVETPDD